MKKFIICTFYILLLGCNAANSNDRQSEKMNQSELKEIKVKAESGVVILIGTTSNEQMHGECQWYDTRGIEITSGEFKNGKPWNGTFLDWSLFDEKESVDNAFDIDYYCQDWITFYESSFLSQKVDFSPITIRYKNGKNTEL